MKLHTRVRNGLMKAFRIFKESRLSKKSSFGIFYHRPPFAHKKNFGLCTSFALAAALQVLFLNLALAQDEDLQSRLGPFKLQLRTENPLREAFNFNSRPTPVAFDQNKDGDIDVVIADFDGGNGFALLRNDGTNTAPAFNYTMYWDNPFNYIPFDDGATPTFSDLDNDGDLDMLLGVLDGTFRFYKNNPEATYKYSLQNGAWDPVTKTGNPFHGIDLGDYASPFFIDMDSDGDDDIVVGTSYLPNNKSIHYYRNDGEGNFSAGSLQGINPALAEATPAFLDADQDGDKDVIIGAEDGNIYYFQRTGETSFEEKTGTANPFNGINKGQYSSPSAADFDNDGDMDVIIGAANPLMDIFYFENKGNGSFEEKHSFDNPFGGIDAGQDASPYFTDFDNDGDADMILGNGYGSAATLRYFENVNGSYKEDASTNPFTDLAVPAVFVPSFIDLDGDGDKDLAGSVTDGQEISIEYYKNENGVFARQTFAESPFKDITIDEGKSDFIDIDNDGDLDLFISEGIGDGWDATYSIRFYKNTGTAQAPVFTAMTGADNPLSQVVEEFVLFPRFIDIDHDGDLDGLIGEGGDVIENLDGNEFLYYENTGSITSPEFTYRGDLIRQGDNPYGPAPAFIDYDEDGDLDAFIGGQSGTISLYKNVNPPAVVTIAAEPLLLRPEETTALIDSQLVISDADNDSLVYAGISIIPFEAGKEKLTFTPQAGITGSFNSTTGTLTLTGKAPIASYQAVLRTVVYEYNHQSNDNVTVTRTIAIAVNDSDNTTTPAKNKIITIVSGQPPLFNDHAVSVSANALYTIDLSQLISDADNNLDWNSLAVLTSAESGAGAGIDNNSMLLMDYTNVNFTGTETVVLQVCDLDNHCSQGTISITVTNNAPVIDDRTITLSYGKAISTDLSPLISDPDGNINYGTLTITQQPGSGAAVSVNDGLTLTIDYQGKTFAGTEMLTLGICDKIGACDESTITINVTNTPPVIQPEPVSTPQATTKVLNLLEITSDPDENLDPSTLTIVAHPISGAKASIEFISDVEVNLTLNYSGITFSGTDQLTIRACDQAGACTESILPVEVDITSMIEVYNAVAPNSTGDNKFMRISNLPQINKVTIFNRWGDKVFGIENYDNETPGKRFEGIGNNGKLLETGTYFYKVEFAGNTQVKHTLTGFLSIK